MYDQDSEIETEGFVGATEGLMKQEGGLQPILGLGSEVVRA